MRSISLLVSFVLAVAIAIPSAGQKTDRPFRTAGAFIALSVPDVPAGIEWYSDTLGLQITTQEPKHDKALFAVLEGGGLSSFYAICST